MYSELSKSVNMDKLNENIKRQQSKLNRIDKFLDFMYENRVWKRTFREFK